MGRHDFYKKGQWKVVCDVCGLFYHSSDLKRRWDGLMVCEKDWNPRQPQDFVRGIPDPQAIPWSRPDAEPVFVEIKFTSRIAETIPLTESVNFMPNLIEPLEAVGIAETVTVSVATSLAETVGIVENVNAQFSSPAAPIDGAAINAIPINRASR